MRSRSFVASFAGKLWDSESVAEAAKVRSQVAALGEAPGFRALALAIRYASLLASPVVSPSSLVQGQLTTAWTPCAVHVKGKPRLN